jgi:hypothetical protein
MSTSQTQVLSPEAISDRPWPRWRVVLIRVWAGLLTIQMLIMAQGVAVVASVGEGLHFAAGTSTVFKLLSLGGVAWVMWSGGRSVSAYWMILVGQLSWAVTRVLAPQVDGNPPLLDLANVLIFYGPLVALRPHRRELLHPRVHPRALTTTLAAVGSFGLIAFAWHIAGGSPGAELAFDAVGLYLTLALMSLFAATRPAGGRWLIPAVAVGTVVTASFAIAYPHDMASPGRLGAALLLLWAVANAAATRFESTTTQANR